MTWDRIVAWALIILLVVLALTLPDDADARVSDERRLAAFQHSAFASFPQTKCGSVKVHLRAGRKLNTTFPGEGVFGMASTCEIWLRGRLDRLNFRYTLYHEMAHTAGWEHGQAMDDVVSEALYGVPNGQGLVDNCGLCG